MFQSSSFQDDIKKLHKRFLLIAHPDVIAEDFDKHLRYHGKWELVHSFKIRKCLLTKEPITLFTTAYKGVVDYDGSKRTFWVSKCEFLLRELKKVVGQKV